MVPVAISVLLVLSGSLFLIAQFSAALTSNRAEIICVMVESDSTEGIISLLADLVDIILAAIPATGVIGWAIKSLFLLLANADTLNTLFDESLVAGYEDADCSECFGCEEQIWDFETGNNGYEVATVFPVCFELPDPGAGNVSVTGGVLTLTGVDTGDTFTAGMRKADVDHPFTIDLNLSATLRNSVATGGIYIDAVIITDTGCFWRTMSNSFNSQVFTGLGLLLNDITGNVIQEIWIYCSSAVSGTELVVEFEDLGLYCTAP